MHESGNSLPTDAGSGDEAGVACEAPPSSQSAHPWSDPAIEDVLLQCDPGLLEGAEVQEAPLPSGPAYGRESMYVELVQEMICVVLENEAYLFTERECACLSHLLLLSYDARYLFVRLVQRKRAWHRVDRLGYEKEMRSMRDACSELCTPFGIPSSPTEALGSDHDLYRLAMMDTEMEGGVEARLALLTLEELKRLAKKMGIARATTREAMLTNLLAKPTNATLQGWRRQSTAEDALDTPAAHQRLAHELRGMFAGCIRLVPDVCALVDRVALVYHRGKPALGSLLTSAVLARTKKCHFPQYTPRRTPDLFASRPLLLQLEHALQLEATLETHLEALPSTATAAPEGVTCLDTAWPLWGRALAEVRAAFPNGTDPAAYIRMRFHPGWVLTRVLYKGCECLARLGQWQRERTVLEALLSQRYFRRGRRGQWHERLALLCAKPESGRDAADAKRASLAYCKLALADVDTHLVYQSSLQRRMARLEAQLKVPVKERSAASLALRTATTTTVVGTRLSPPAPAKAKAGRSVWRSADASPCTVEELCLEAYARRGYVGYHCEGNIVLFLFTLLMWDILFAPVDGAFETAYQREPLDLPTEVFAVARHERIAQRLADIEANGGLAHLRATDARERPRKTYAVACRWDDYTAAEMEQVAECLGGAALATLCRLLAEEWSIRTSGFPDLCVWRYADKHICFAEVKGPNDRLSEKQKVWIDVLLRAGLSVELALVEEANAPKRRSVSPAKGARPAKGRDGVAPPP